MPPSALQLGSLATTSHTSLPIQNPCKIPHLKPLRPSFSLHFSLTRTKIATLFSPPLTKLTQAHNNYARIKQSAVAGEVSNGAKTEEEEDEEEEGASITQGPDDDVPEPGQQFAEFCAGAFYFPELAFQRLPGVTKTEVGYSQGRVHNPTTIQVEKGNTGHAEVVRVQYDPNEVSYDDLLDTFWECHDPTQKNRQGYYMGTNYRSGIYFYSPEQEKAARESLERQQKRLDKKIVTEILPAKKFYRAEDYLQQYLESGVSTGKEQSAAKGCKDPIIDYDLFL